jgi:hypothetical protein
MINSGKVMVMIAWNQDGFHVIEILTKGRQFNPDYSCSSGFKKLSKIARHFRNERRIKLTLHVDNARPHIAKSNLEFCTR